MKIERKKFLVNVAIILIAVLAALWFNLNEDWTEKEPERSGGPARPKIEQFVLALSWQPAFCEKKPNKPECRSQRKGRFDTGNFSLHGLWPQPQDNIYCDPKFPSSGRWSQLPRLNLSDDLRQELSIKMPGYRSYLHRHEWVKHGTCAAGITPQRYYEVSLKLLDAINGSLLRDYFADRIGGEVSVQQARKLMNRSFGEGAGERLGFDCARDNRRTLVAEIRLSLAFDPNAAGQSPSEQIMAGSVAKGGCRSGIVDPAGLQ